MKFIVGLVAGFATMKYIKDKTTNVVYQSPTDPLKKMLNPMNAPSINKTVLDQVSEASVDAQKIYGYSESYVRKEIDALSSELNISPDLLVQSLL